MAIYLFIYLLIYLFIHNKDLPTPVFTHTSLLLENLYALRRNVAKIAENNQLLVLSIHFFMYD